MPPGFLLCYFLMFNVYQGIDSFQVLKVSYFRDHLIDEFSVGLTLFFNAAVFHICPSLWVMAPGGAFCFNSLCAYYRTVVRLLLSNFSEPLK